MGEAKQEAGSAERAIPGSSPGTTKQEPYPRGYNRENFLADLIVKEGFTRVAELGVWKGRTFLHLLTHCPNTTVIGVDAWKARPENAGVEGGETYEKWDMAGLEAYVRLRSRPFGERAIIHKMETHEAAALVPDGSLDLVFIDADHSAEGVARDIAGWRPKLKPGGVLAGHDIDWPTVRAVVERDVGAHYTGPDNVWWSRPDCLGQLLTLAPAGPRLEMGVFHGATLKRIAAHAGLTVGVDSFAGMAAPSPRDIKDGWNPYPEGRLACPLATVARRVPGARLIEGYVPAVLGKVPNGPWAFAHLDMDHYEPTLAALEWLWPRMVAGGVIACDDWFRGRDWLAGGAINEFARRHPMTGTAGKLAWWVKEDRAA